MVAENPIPVVKETEVDVPQPSGDNAEKVKFISFDFNQLTK
jgi:hypothetical protein